jgi:hypothetical protein
MSEGEEQEEPEGIRKEGEPEGIRKLFTAENISTNLPGQTLE